MDKLKMAHEYAMECLRHMNQMKLDCCEKKLSAEAWNYADAMQAEADKREVKGAPKSVLHSTKSNQLDLSLITHDIDCYFDNSNNTKRDADNLIQSIYEQLTGEFKAADLSEWQPDWSQAPNGYSWWAFDGFSRKANWYNSKPYIDDESEGDDEWNIGLQADTKVFLEAPSFNYQGNWKNSLRKRPD